ncbi:MAG: response regulator [Candidatus Omnitrophica bacterium]|nr:response regulator [Candidatus Omnitrophota bacterium]MCB9781363.1 response regulator [Candidatus Omnitrophota bacterium]
MIRFSDRERIKGEGRPRMKTDGLINRERVEELSSHSDEPTSTLERILVVDDDPSVLDFLAKLLVRQGYQVETASSFGEAITLLQESPFALTLTDLSLPDGNGIDLINRVHSRDPHAICILITGFGTMESAIDAIHARVYDFLPKPFDMNQLLATVRNGLERRCLEIENQRLIEELQAERQSLQVRVDEATQDLQTKLNEVEKLNNEITVLFEIMRDIRGDLRMSESLDRLSEYLKRALEFDSLFWVVTDMSDQLISHRDLSDAIPSQFALHDLSPSQLEDLRSLISGKEDLGVRQSLIRNWMMTHLEPDLKGGDLIVGPFRTSSEFFGVIGVCRSSRFGEEDQRLLSLAVSQLVTLWEENAVIQRGSQMASIGELTAEVAHDLRNGISALRHITDHFLGEIDLSDPQNADYQEVLTENLCRTDDLIRELLALGRQEEDLSHTTPVRKLLDRVLRISGRTLERNRVAVEVIVDDEDLVVSGSIKEISEALINVIMNSIQAMEQGGKLTLGAQTSQPASEAEESMGRFVRIFVTDTGQGIPPENLKRVFGRYFTTKSEGTGLGLPRLQKLAKKHLGRTEIESEVGKGTTVSLFLPRV